MNSCGIRKLFVVLALVAASVPAGCRKRTAPPQPPVRDDSQAAPPAVRHGGAVASPATRWAQAATNAGIFSRRTWVKIYPHLRAAVVAALGELAADPATHIRAGDRALALGRSEAAVECFYRAVDLNPNRPDALQGLAVALVAARRYEEAVPIYEMIIGIFPAGATARFNLAIAMSRLRRFDRAEQEYRKLLAEHEDFVEARYNLASLYQAQGKLALARDAWREVLSRAGHLSGAHSALGEVLIDLGDAGGAMAAYAEAAKLRPGDASTWRNLATAARQGGSYGRALVAAKRAARLTDEDPAVWNQLGQILLEIHRSTGERKFLAEATIAWRRSLALDPTQEHIAKVLETYTKALEKQASDQG